MERPRPRQKLLKRACNLLVSEGVVAGKKHRSVGLACVANRNPVEIAGAVRGKAEAFAPAALLQVNCVLLAFQVERKKRFDPLGALLAVARVRTSDFDFFSQNCQMVGVKRDKTLREKPANSLLDFGRIWKNETIPEGLAGRLQLFRCLSVAELMEKSANTGGRNEQQEGEGERTENLDEESLRKHTDMVQEKRPPRAMIGPRKDAISVCGSSKCHNGSKSCGCSVRNQSLATHIAVKDEEERQIARFARLAN